MKRGSIIQHYLKIPKKESQLNASIFRKFKEINGLCGGLQIVRRTKNHTDQRKNWEKGQFKEENQLNVLFWIMIWKMVVCCNKILIEFFEQIILIKRSNHD